MLYAATYLWPSVKFCVGEHGNEMIVEALKVQAQETTGYLAVSSDNCQLLVLKVTKPSELGKTSFRGDRAKNKAWKLHQNKK